MFYFICIYVYMYISVRMYTKCVQVLVEGRRELQILWNWSYGWL